MSQSTPTPRIPLDRAAGRLAGILLEQTNAQGLTIVKDEPLGLVAFTLARDSQRLRIAVADELLMTSRPVEIAAHHLRGQAAWRRVHRA